MDSITAHIDVQGLGENGCMLIDSYGRPMDPDAQMIFDDPGSTFDQDDYSMF